MVAQQVRQLPHQDMEVGTESITVFDTPAHPPLYLGFKQNGVPFGVGISPPANGNWNPALKFSNWVRGAGEVAPVLVRGRARLRPRDRKSVV